MKCGNTRTIALINHAIKIMLKIMAQRIKIKIKEEIADKQAGLYQGRAQEIKL